MLLPQLPDQVADFNDLKRVKADGRLVQNDDFGIAQQRLRNTDALLVAFGQRRDPLATYIPDPDLFDHLPDLQLPRTYQTTAKS